MVLIVLFFERYPAWILPRASQKLWSWLCWPNNLYWFTLAPFHSEKTLFRLLLGLQCVLSRGSFTVMKRPKNSCWLRVEQFFGCHTIAFVVNVANNFDTRTIVTKRKFSKTHFYHWNRWFRRLLVFIKLVLGLLYFLPQKIMFAEHTFLSFSIFAVIRATRWFQWLSTTNFWGNR